MKKICNIDSIKLYNENSIYPWLNEWTRKRKINPDWIKASLSPAQQKFLENRRAVFRPHPRHTPTIELFIDETELDSRDWTVLYLIF
jgi:hypothetical protein